MSHVVSSSIIITDLDCLRAAVAKFPKLRWMEGQKKYSWFGTWMADYSREDAAYKLGIDPESYGTCDHAIRVDGAEYEVGVVRRKDGTGWSLVWDFYASGREINKAIGNSAEKLVAEYSQEFISQFAMTNGYMLNRSTDDEGNLCLEMMR